MSIRKQADYLIKISIREIFNDNYLFFIDKITILYLYIFFKCFFKIIHISKIKILFSAIRFVDNDDVISY